MTGVDVVSKKMCRPGISLLSPKTTLKLRQQAKRTLNLPIRRRDPRILNTPFNMRRQPESQNKRFVPDPRTPHLESQLNQHSAPPSYQAPKANIPQFRQTLEGSHQRRTAECQEGPSFVDASYVHHLLENICLSVSKVR